MSKRTTSHIIAAALAVTAACSSSNKKAVQTTPTADSSRDAVEDVEQPVRISVDDQTPQEDDGPPPASLQTVYFEFDSAVLTEDARQQLHEAARWMEQNPDKSLTIAGHTDQVGTDEYNLALGDARAQAVYRYMLSLGVAPGRLKTISYGEAIPADPNVDARNRRGEFVPTETR